MPISSAVQRGNTVFVYNEKNQPLFNQPAGYGPKDGLVGYTAASVSIRRGNTVFTYNQRGQAIGNQPVR